MALPMKRMSRHWLCWPRRQYRHSWQGRLGLTATLVPGDTPVTSLPTSSIVPAISCPSAIGSWRRTVPKPPWW